MRKKCHIFYANLTWKPLQTLLDCCFHHDESFFLCSFCSACRGGRYRIGSPGTQWPSVLCKNVPKFYTYLKWRCIPTKDKTEKKYYPPRFPTECRITADNVFFCLIWSWLNSVILHVLFFTLTLTFIQNSRVDVISYKCSGCSEPPKLLLYTCVKSFISGAMYQTLRYIMRAFSKR